MRISDWSSDVCSSDLSANRWNARHHWRHARRRVPGGSFPGQQAHADRVAHRHHFAAAGGAAVGADGDVGALKLRRQREHVARLQRGQVADAHLEEARSEEQTSELQSLMRISYAVFCLKKK